MKTNRSKIKKSTGDYIFDSLNVLFMLIVVVIMLLPMIHVVSVSFSTGSEVLKGGLFLYPKGFSTKAYEKVFSDKLIGTAYLNTILYAVAHTVLVLLLTAMVAYPLSVSNFVMKKQVTVFLTITMFISGGTIPTYVLMQNLHLINNRLVMILPFAVGAYNVILFRTFFQGIDSGIRESAYMDGAGEFRILFQIILPLSKAILATIALFTMVGKWNEWFSALIYLNEETKYPLQMVLRKLIFLPQGYDSVDPTLAQMFRDKSLVPQSLQMATIVVITLPILCVYPFVQKYFAKGVFVGSIKG